MDLDEYQRAALRTVNQSLDEHQRLLDASMGLCEESGEVLGLVRKRLLQSRDVGQERLAEELGDVLWCLAVTANTLGLSLSEVARANVAKLHKRHPGDFVSPPLPPARPGDS